MLHSNLAESKTKEAHGVCSFIRLDNATGSSKAFLLAMAQAGRSPLEKKTDLLKTCSAYLACNRHGH